MNCLLDSISRDHPLPPLAWWAASSELSHFTSADRSAFVAYRVAGSVAVTVGEPMGDPRAIPQLAASFERWCGSQGLTACWWHVTGRWLGLLGGRSARVARIGDFGVIDLPGFSMEGAAWRDVRSSLHRLPRLGYGSTWYSLTGDPSRWNEALAAIDLRWLASRRLPQLRHSVGSFERSLRSPELRCRVLVSPGGGPAAFLTFAPLYTAGGGYSLDLVRGAAGLPRDSMLYLLATAILDLRAEGFARAALGLAPLSISPAEAAGEDTPLVLRALRGLAWERSHRRYDFKGLQFFKRRLRPQWEPRYVVYPSLPSLPRVVRALCHAHGLRCRILPYLLLG